MRPDQVFGRSTTRRALLAFALAAGAPACGATAPASTDGTPFVAFASDFAGFHDWPSAAAMPSPNLPSLDGGDFALDGGATDGGVHPPPETEYWKLPSPPTGGVFPLRTIIVKETNEADPTARQVFAMVKRGGDFNPTGAVNWEWYELKNNADGTVVVSWQGYGPPSGSADLYGGNPAVCNNCHVKAAANDYVWSAALQLSSL